MAETVEAARAELVPAQVVARDAAVLTAANGLRYAAYGDVRTGEAELRRMVESVPLAMAGALKNKVYYFVPLTIAEGAELKATPAHGGETLVAPEFTVEWGDRAVCHRNVELGETDGVFISTQLMNDRFALAFEFAINVGHAVVDGIGVPESFSEMVWKQAEAQVKGETSQDAWESRGRAMTMDGDRRPRVDEKEKSVYLECAFADAIAIYLLSLTVDFDYAELREREYPMLTPQALGDRLKHVAGLFPPNEGYEFAVLYRRRA